MYKKGGSLKALVNSMPFSRGATNKRRRKSLSPVECIKYENGGKF